MLIIILILAVALTSFHADQKPGIITIYRFPVERAC